MGTTSILLQAVVNNLETSLSIQHTLTSYIWGIMVIQPCVVLEASVYYGILYPLNPLSVPCSCHLSTFDHPELFAFKEGTGEA